MNIIVSKTAAELGRVAAAEGARRIHSAIAAGGHASIILATGASQFHVLDHLVGAEVPWERVRCFHLDEYVGLGSDHPASFRKYLRERFVDKVPMVKSFEFIDPGDDPDAECARLAREIGGVTIDVAFVGIGENGHLAFNDPPADFDIVSPYLVVDLDEACRKQQLNEGWFGSLGEVPKRAISMSVDRILRSKTIICSVPDARKANAVHCAVDGEVSPMCPASVLQRHPDCHLFLDQDSAGQLDK